MGPQASARLLDVMVSMFARDFEVKSDQDFPEIILDSVPVPNFISDDKNVSLALSILKNRLRNLEAFNPSCFAIPCNTAHLLLNDLQTQTNVPFVSIIDEVTKKVIESKVTKVGLLSSPTTLRTGLYTEKLIKKNVEVIGPTKKELAQVERIIFKVLVGKVNDRDRQKIVSIANSLRRKGAEGIILGCTELPLVFPRDFPGLVFDSIEILAEATLRKSYERKI